MEKVSRNTVNKKQNGLEQIVNEKQLTKIQLTKNKMDLNTS